MGENTRDHDGNLAAIDATGSGEMEDDSDVDILEQFVKGGGLAFSANMFNKVVGVFFQLLLARFLGPAAYGLYVLGWTVAAYGRPLVLLGLPDGLVRFIPKHVENGEHDKVRGTVYISFGITIILSLILAAGLLTSSEYLAANVFDNPGFANVLGLFALSLPLFVTMRIATSTAVAFRQVQYQQVVQNILFPILKLAAVGFFLFVGYQLVGAVYGLLLAVGLSALAAVVLLPRVFTGVDFRGGYSSEPSALLRFSVPILLVDFGGLALTQTDRLLLGALGTSSQVGVYNIAYILSQQVLIFFTAILVVFNPVVSELYTKENFEQLQRMYTTVTRWVFVFSVPSVIVGSLFASELLSLFNPEFASGEPLLMVLLVAQLVYVSIGPAKEILTMSDQQDIVLVDMLVMLVGNVGLNLVLIPRMGSMGAAIATLVTITVVESTQIYQAKRRIGVFPFDRRYYKALAVGIGFLVVSYAVLRLHLSFVPRVGVVAAVLLAYLLVVWQMIITETDRRTMRMILD